MSEPPRPSRRIHASQLTCMDFLRTSAEGASWASNQTVKITAQWYETWTGFVVIPPAVEHWPRIKELMGPKRQCSKIKQVVVP